MTQDEIMEMARQAHFDSKTWVDIFADNPTVGDVRNYLIAFAKLVAAKERDRIANEARDIIKRSEARGAAKEREACAKVCEDGLNIATCLNALDDMEMWGEKFAKAIRARGEQA